MFVLPVRSATRALAALALAATVSLASLPTAALAADPPRPLPGYTPHFVSERTVGPWEDCVWASAAMLLDKWTSGVTRSDRKTLRKLSGDTEGGSSLVDVTKAFAHLGFPLTWSPMGGDNVIWPELLDRLAHGGGAILLGDYGKLPRRYGRWEPNFWAGENDDHALYLDRYNRKTGRILVMDPLAPPGWTGEWIPVSALKEYAWRNHAGRLWVAMTPAASLGPVKGVELGEPVVVADATHLDISWSIERTPEGWTYAGSSVSAEFTRVAEPEPLARIVAAQPFDTVAAVAAVPASPPATPTSTVVDGVVRATVALPAEPGIYRVTASVIDRRLGGQFAAAGPFDLYVPGQRAASFIVPSTQSAEPGGLLPLSFAVRNIGAASWMDARLTRDLPFDLQPARNTRLIATWVSEAPTLDVDAAPGEDAAFVGSPPPPPIDLGLVPFGASFGLRIEALVRVPARPGAWRLVIDVVDDVNGSFAMGGSAPGIVDVEVFAPRPDSGAH